MITNLSHNHQRRCKRRRLLQKAALLMLSSRLDLLIRKPSSTLTKSIGRVSQKLWSTSTTKSVGKLFSKITFWWKSQIPRTKSRDWRTLITRCCRGSREGEMRSLRSRQSICLPTGFIYWLIPLLPWCHNPSKSNFFISLRKMIHIRLMISTLIKMSFRLISLKRNSKSSWIPKSIRTRRPSMRFTIF